MIQHGDGKIYNMNIKKEIKHIENQIQALENRYFAELQILLDRLKKIKSQFLHKWKVLDDNTESKEYYCKICKIYKI